MVNSFGTRWLNAWLPAGFTTRWYVSAWNEFQLHDVLIVTFEVVGAVVVLSGLLGVPAAYALARRNFPGKQFVILLFLLPMLIPPITFGIPLATVLYQAHFGGNLTGVILANRYSADILLVASLTAYIAVFGHVLLAVAGLVLVEQIYRNTPLDQRWAIKFLCIGVGGLFVYDFYMYANGLLFKQLDSRPGEPRMCPHSSFDDATAPADALRRRSIEVRVLGVFER